MHDRFWTLSQLRLHQPHRPALKDDRYYRTRDNRSDQRIERPEAIRQLLQPGVFHVGHADAGKTATEFCLDALVSDLVDPRAPLGEFEANLQRFDCFAAHLLRNVGTYENERQSLQFIGNTHARTESTVSSFSCT